MANYFAQIVNKEVVQVIVAPSADWCVANLGGVWEETSDPYTEEAQIVTYCGPGYKHDPGVIEKFVSDVWSLEKATTPDPLSGLYRYIKQGELTWHNDRAWRNLMPDDNPNVWEPPTNWREYPMGTEHPIWIQPSGAVDAYPLDFVVEHNDKAWVSITPANVWEPGAVGSENLWKIYSPWADWVLPTIPDDEYMIGDKVTHLNEIWESTIDNNLSEPGTNGDWLLI